MSYQRIQQVLEADPMFASKVADKDTEVPVRGGETVKMNSLIVNVHTTLKAAGCNMQAVAKNTILAAAARLSAGGPVPVMAPVSVVQPKPAAPSAPKKKEGTPVAPRPLQSTTKPVVVTTARAGAQRQVPDKPLDAEVIHTYQCAVASAQLLAALHQLMERDNFPGHEVRKKKLDELITSFEEMSSNHVNFSVKAIIESQANA